MEYDTVILLCKCPMHLSDRYGVKIKPFWNWHHSLKKLIVNDSHFFAFSFQALEHNILPSLLGKIKSQLNVISSMNPSLTDPSNNAFMSTYAFPNHSIVMWLTNNNWCRVKIVHIILLLCVSPCFLEKQNE